MAKRKKPEPRKSYEVTLGRAAVPPELNDPAKRRQWDLPEGDETPGEYMVELNLQHIGGLEGASAAFLRLYSHHVGAEAETARAPVRVSRTYYSCLMSAREWRAMVAEDERTGEGTARQRCIYRIWPDFPVRAQMDRSIATVKGDAALRSYEASGDGIVWAVVDSGVSAAHPHFGEPTPAMHHTLLAADVVELHRCFVPLPRQAGGVPLAPHRLPDPDEPEPKLSAPEQAAVDTARGRQNRPNLAVEPKLAADDRAVVRDLRVKQHRAEAFNDEFGHGTHVAGIIAGGLGDNPNATPAVFERRFAASNGQPKTVELVPRNVTDKSRLRGVAPRCKLISLRVLDEHGKGRSSDIMLALEYIREKLNGDPKMFRVHGVNLSVGYEFDAEMFACGQSPLCVEVNRLVQSGVVVVTAAGNTGYGTVGADVGAAKAGIANTINDPGNAAQAITVGATHREYPHTYGVSYFSSKGPTGDGRLKPDLVAPGERVTSCAAGAKLQEIEKDHGALPANAAPYVDDSGTSMAAPHVSGAIAAFLSIRREFIGQAQEVKKIFLNTATPLGRERYFEGHGLVDLMRAIQSV